MLQVHGVNQLAKEIEECKDLPEKVYNELFLHRNEETYEIEGANQMNTVTAPSRLSTT